MAKYMVLYNSSTSASQQMAQASEAEMKAGMDAWMRWKDALDAAIKFDFGMPLQATGRVTGAGQDDSDSNVSGYSIMEGDKGAILNALSSHPHLQRPDASIDLLEMLSMPGMEG